MHLVGKRLPILMLVRWSESKSGATLTFPSATQRDVYRTPQRYAFKSESGETIQASFFRLNSKITPCIIETENQQRPPRPSPVVPSPTILAVPAASVVVAVPVPLLTPLAAAAPILAPARRGKRGRPEVESNGRQAVSVASKKRAKGTRKKEETLKPEVLKPVDGVHAELPNVGTAGTRPVLKVLEVAPCAPPIIEHPNNVHVIEETKVEAAVVLGLPEERPLPIVLPLNDSCFYPSQTAGTPQRPPPVEEAFREPQRRSSRRGRKAASPGLTEMPSDVPVGPPVTRRQSGAASQAAQLHVHPISNSVPVPDNNVPVSQNDVPVSQNDVPAPNGVALQVPRVEQQQRPQPTRRPRGRPKRAAK